MSDETMGSTLRTERLLAERVVCTGTVKWFSTEDGHGWISPDEGDEDLLVEAANLAEAEVTALTEGARVEFEVGVGHEGLEAFQVVAIRTR
jgi:CspA family cold shock protein